MSLRNMRGKISMIPNNHTGVINFQMRKGTVQASFFLAALHINGVKAYGNNIRDFIREGDEVSFDAEPNKKENSLKIRYIAKLVWKGNRPSLAESKDAVAVTNPLEGKIVHLTEKEGVVGFVPDLQDLQTQHCFFGSGQLFVKQQQIPIGNSLLDYVQLGERVKLHAKKIVGFSKTVASFTCRYSAIRVYKQEPTDPAPLFEPLGPVLRSTSPGLWSTSSRSSSGVASSLSAFPPLAATFDPGLESFDGGPELWQPVGSKGKKKLQTQLLNQQLQLSAESQLRQENQKRTLENQTGTVVELLPSKAVVECQIGSETSSPRCARVLLPFEAMTPDVDCLLGVVAPGDKVQFSARWSSSFNLSDRCDWLCTRAERVGGPPNYAAAAAAKTKPPQVNGVGSPPTLPPPRTTNAFTSKTLNAVSAKVSDLFLSDGILTWLTDSDKADKMIHFTQNVVFRDGIPVAAPLKTSLSLGEVFQVEARSCQPSMSTRQLGWRAVLVWSGAKPTHAACDAPRNAADNEFLCEFDDFDDDDPATLGGALSPPSADSNNNRAKAEDTVTTFFGVPISMGQGGALAPGREGLPFGRGSLGGLNHHDPFSNPGPPRSVFFPPNTLGASSVPSLTESTSSSPPEWDIPLPGGPGAGHAVNGTLEGGKFHPTASESQEQEIAATGVFGSLLRPLSLSTPSPPAPAEGTPSSSSRPPSGAATAGEGSLNSSGTSGITFLKQLVQMSKTAPGPAPWHFPGPSEARDDTRPSSCGSSASFGVLAPGDPPGPPRSPTPAVLPSGDAPSPLGPHGTGPATLASHASQGVESEGDLEAAGGDASLDDESNDFSVIEMAQQMNITAKDKTSKIALQNALILLLIGRARPLRMKPGERLHGLVALWLNQNPELIPYYKTILRGEQGMSKETSDTLETTMKYLGLTPVAPPMAGPPSLPSALPPSGTTGLNPLTIPQFVPRPFPSPPGLPSPPTRPEGLVFSPAPSLHLHPLVLQHPTQAPLPMNIRPPAPTWGVPPGFATMNFPVSMGAPDETPGYSFFNAKARLTVIQEESGEAVFLPSAAWPHCGGRSVFFSRDVCTFQGVTLRGGDLKLYYKVGMNVDVRAVVPPSNAPPTASFEAVSVAFRSQE